MLLLLLAMMLSQVIQREGSFLFSFSKHGVGNPRAHFGRFQKRLRDRERPTRLANLLACSPQSLTGCLKSLSSKSLYSYLKVAQANESSSGLAFVVVF